MTLLYKASSEEQGKRQAGSRLGPFHARGTGEANGVCVPGVYVCVCVCLCVCDLRYCSLGGTHVYSHAVAFFPRCLTLHGSDVDVLKTHVHAHVAARAATCLTP